MALMAKPALLILDEPTTALDVTVEAGIVDIVKALGEKYGTSMLFISHNLGLVLDVCDRICVMYSGEAVETGNVAEVFTDMRHPYTQALFRSIPLPGADKNARPLISIPGNFPLPHERPPGCNFGPRCDYFEKGRCDAADIAMDPVPGGDRHASRCLKWAEIDWTAPPKARVTRKKTPPGRLVLRMEDLKKYYNVATGAFGGGAKKVVKANETLSFEAREGETLAIVGESGCGKSTFAKVLMGLENRHLRQDHALRRERAVHPHPEARRQHHLQAADGVPEPLRHAEPFDDRGPPDHPRARGLPEGRQRRDRERMMLELLDLVKLPRAFAERMPRQLSGGQKQRVGIARAFAGGAKVVIADEPVSALDVSVQAAVTDLLMDIQRENRTTLLFISHDLSIVRYLSDRVMVMYLGHVVEMGRPNRSSPPPTTPTPRRSCPPCRSPTRMSRASASCWKAKSPAP